MGTARMGKGCGGQEMTGRESSKTGGSKGLSRGRRESPKEDSLARVKSNERAAAVFAEIDTNGDGMLSKNEFHRAMAGRRKDTLRTMLDSQGKSWKSIYEALDRNHDGEISLEEFQAVVDEVQRAYAEG